MNSINGGFRRVKRGLLGFGPDANFFVEEFNMNHVRAAADGAVFDEVLMVPRRGIDGDHNLFAAGIADVAGFVVHFFDFSFGGWRLWLSSQS